MTIEYSSLNLITLILLDVLNAFHVNTEVVYIV